MGSILSLSGNGTRSMDVVSGEDKRNSIMGRLKKNVKCDNYATTALPNILSETLEY